MDPKELPLKRPLNQNAGIRCLVRKATKFQRVRGDEDDEGRSDNERLVEEGIAEAELYRMDQATGLPRKSEKRSLNLEPEAQRIEKRKPGNSGPQRRQSNR